ncbi:MAG: ATP-binding protein, partial [Candidatus Omnitrophica bacterium]|nr:ATP-binding protein [Candidatus Omnitrophota bacterium]
MITSLTLENFKKIKKETYKFTNFDLLVGRNNSGKSTILQALAIWQYCIEEFSRSNRKGKRGSQIVLPNFTALPLPQFNLLWKDQVERNYPKENGKKTQKYIYIDIQVEWVRDGKKKDFAVQLRYQSPQSVYVIPVGGWGKFKDLYDNKLLPKIVYVPTFSGLEPSEEWRDDSILRKQVGKAQPGSVLRNLLYRVVDRNSGGEGEKDNSTTDWKEIQGVVERFFSVQLEEPRYRKGVDTEIICEYIDPLSKKKFDIISGGSGFHQTLTLLAFMYGYAGLTTILFDEPDAHMFVNLQRETLDYFQRKSTERNVQFLIATHAEELIKGVEAENIISLSEGKPKRISATPEIITALSDVTNGEMTRLRESSFILYVEGEDDERVLRSWANALGEEQTLNRFYFKTMGGGSKKEMQESADRHFDGLKHLFPQVKRMIVFDYDSDASFHPPKNNPVIFEWRRKNIENYLLVQDAWERAVKKAFGDDGSQGNLFMDKATSIIKDFFEQERLTLLKGQSWHDINAEVFKTVDGKKLLFEN